jgi:hypothetical protein
VGKSPLTWHLSIFFLTIAKSEYYNIDIREDYMKKIAVLMFLLAFSQLHAEEDANRFENVSFRWQLLSPKTQEINF